MGRKNADEMEPGAKTCYYFNIIFSILSIVAVIMGALFFLGVVILFLFSS